MGHGIRECIELGVDGEQLRRIATHGRVPLLELLSAFRDALLQLARVLLQLLLLFLDSAEHLVEGVGQHAQFVRAELGRPDRVVLACGDHGRGLGERQYRCRDPSLQRGAQRIGGQERDREDHEGDDPGQPEGVGHGLVPGVDRQAAVGLVRSLRDGREPHEAAPLKTVAIRLWRRGDQIGPGTHWIGREHPPITVIERRGNHMRVVFQRRQHFGRVRLVRKCQRGGAVGGKNARPRGQMSLYGPSEGHHLVGDERGGCQQ